MAICRDEGIVNYVIRFPGVGFFRRSVEILLHNKELLP